MKDKNLFEDSINDRELNDIRSEKDLLEFFQRHVDSTEEFVICLMKAEPIMRRLGLSKDPRFIGKMTAIMYEVPGGYEEVMKKFDEFIENPPDEYQTDLPGDKFTDDIKQKKITFGDDIPTETEEERLKALPKEDIWKMIDIALDNKDYERVKKLRLFLESLGIKLRHLKLFEQFSKE